jgi:hypothetical protein
VWQDLVDTAAGHDVSAQEEHKNVMRPMITFIDSSE